MKRLLFIPLMALLCGLTSCNEKSDSNTDYANTYTYATVCFTDEAEPVVYFKSDTDKDIIITDNQTVIKLEEYEQGERVVIAIRAVETIEGEEYAEYDYTATLYKIFDVTVGQSSVVEDEQTLETISDDSIAYILSDINLYHGYLNTCITYNTKSLEDVKFYLIENLLSDDEVKDGYLNLELRYDDGGESVDSTDNTMYQSYVSFDMEQFRTQLEGKQGVKLRIYSAKSGKFFVTVSSQYLFN